MSPPSKELTDTQRLDKLVKALETHQLWNTKDGYYGLFPKDPKGEPLTDVMYKDVRQLIDDARTS